MPQRRTTPLWESYNWNNVDTATGACARGVSTKDTEEQLENAEVVDVGRLISDDRWSFVSACIVAIQRCRILADELIHIAQVPPHLTTGSGFNGVGIENTLLRAAGGSIYSTLEVKVTTMLSDPFAAAHASSERTRIHGCVKSISP